MPEHATWQPSDDDDRWHHYSPREYVHTGSPRAYIVLGVVVVLVAATVALGISLFGHSGGSSDSSEADPPPAVELSIGARDTLLMSAYELRHDAGRKIDYSSWRYDTPACVVLSDYFGGFLTTAEDRARDYTTDDIKQTFMLNGPVGETLRNFVDRRGGNSVEEITAAAMACSEYIAAQH